jgi:hypothetical protein
MPDVPPTIQFRPGPLLDLLNQRAADGLSAALVAKRDLERYYWVVGEELRHWRLTEQECCLICDALNGVYLFDAPWHIRSIWAEVADAIRLNGLDEKWGLRADEGAKLVERLRAASPGALAALADAVEQFWRHTDLPTAEALRRVGLLKKEAEE